MAASRNNTNSNSSAESNGGFKTVAFGFDKNDVTLYIAGLRKKMKTMEEEFEQKLSQALENPTASNEALKHEREVIRAEMEKMWGDKLNERNNILKQQQRRIEELEQQADEDKNTIASLKAQLTAATSENNTDGAINARAAKAYMQFTAELRAISDSVNKTLMQIHSSWSGDFGAQAEKMAQADAQAARAMEAAVVAPDTAAEPAAAPAPAAPPAQAEAPAPAKAPAAPELYISGDPFADDEEKNPLEDLIADIGADVKPAPSNDYADIDSSLFADDTDTSQSADIKAEIDEKPKAEPVKEAPKPKNVKKEMPAKAAAPQPEAPKPEPAKPEPAKSEPAKSKPIKAEPVKTKPAKTEEKPVDEVDFDLLIEEPKSEVADLLIEEPKSEAAAEDDFADISALLSDDSPAISEPIPAAPPKKEPPRKAPSMIAADDDLSSLLADDDSESLITPVDNRAGATDDFADLLAEFDKPVDMGEDIVIDETRPKVDKGIDLDVDILSDIVINPEVTEQTADLGNMLGQQDNDDFAQFGDLFVTPTDENRNDGLGISAENIDFGADSVDDLAAAAKEKAKKVKKEADPFDFSFLGSNSDDDEDDMSTDVSFDGMM